MIADNDIMIYEIKLNGKWSLTSDDVPTEGPCEFCRKR